MKLFSKDDEAYLAWLADNPAGYVINIRAVHDTELRRPAQRTMPA